MTTEIFLDFHFTGKHEWEEVKKKKKTSTLIWLQIAVYQVLHCCLCAWEVLAKLLILHLTVTAKPIYAHKLSCSSIRKQQPLLFLLKKPLYVTVHKMDFSTVDISLFLAANNTHSTTLLMYKDVRSRGKSELVSTCLSGMVEICSGVNFFWLALFLPCLDEQVLRRNAFVQCFHATASVWLVLSAVHYVEP